MTMSDVKIHHLSGGEESILLKGPQNPRPSTESMQSLSNYQWNCSQI